MNRGHPGANEVLRRIHNGFVALAVALGCALLLMLVGPTPPGLGYLAGGLGLAGVFGGYAYAAHAIGSDDRLDPAHAHWARTIRTYGMCIGIAAAVLIGLDWMGPVGA